jgi:cobalt transporter subunit CbtB
MTASPQSPALPTTTPAVPLRDILPWAAFAAALALVVVYLVGMEQGGTALLSGTAVHEFVHDGRHLLGFPCH